MHSFASIRRLAAVALATAAIVAPLAVPAAEAAPPSPKPCQLQAGCDGPGNGLDRRPDLYVSTMFQRDIAGNSISIAAAGQTVVYPLTIGNRGLQPASDVEVWWQADTVNFNGQGWRLVSYTSDSGFVCHEPGEAFTGLQVRCTGGTVTPHWMSNIRFVMRAPTTPGQHHINAWLDPLNRISETNESNNAPCCLTLFT